jgi:hypothetical protein
MKEREVKRVLIAAALVAVSGLSAVAKTSGDMDCSHYMAMNEAGQTATVNSMRSKMPSAHKMPSRRYVRSSSPPRVGGDTQGGSSGFR